MRIDQALDEVRPCFSFEFFPPKTDEGMENLWSALTELREDEPTYVSVTYGAGGSTRDRTIDITKRIKKELGIEAMAHFTCVGATVDELRSDARRDARRRHRERARAARRPAAGPGRVDRHRGRPVLLDRARRADQPRTTTSRSAPPASPRCTSHRRTWSRTSTC